MKEKVCLYNCTNYDVTKIAGHISKAIDRLGGLERLFRNKQKILLKVNCLFGAEPSKAITTHPEVVRAAIKVLKDKGFECHIGDSPATNNFLTESISSGFHKVAKKEKVPLVQLDQPVLKNGIYVSKKIESYDAIINFPKLKTHILTGLTGAVKNMYGVVPGKIKSSYHIKYSNIDDLSKLFLNLYQLQKPVLNIMDAIEAMEGNGPANGQVRRLNTILVSKSGLSIDRISADMTNHKVDELPILKIAQTKGLKDSFRKNIEIIGKAPKISFKKSVRPTKHVPQALLNSVINKYAPMPEIDAKKCIKCKNCINICPKDAIIESEKLKIGKQCAKCYCCKEVCPVDAVNLKTNLLNKMITKICGLLRIK